MNEWSSGHVFIIKFLTKLSLKFIKTSHGITLNIVNGFKIISKSKNFTNNKKIKLSKMIVKLMNIWKLVLKLKKKK